jgi:hypothetical protein
MGHGDAITARMTTCNHHVRSPHVVITAHQVASYGPVVTEDDRGADDRRTMPAGGSEEMPHYEVHVRGHLGPQWAAWFDGLSISNEADGTSFLRGPLVDQAALHGVLRKVRDLGLSLASLTQLAPSGSSVTDATRSPTPDNNQPGASA